MASPPWPAMGSSRETARARFGWPWITLIRSGTQWDTYTLWFILAFKYLFMGQQKVTDVHLHFPAAYCPFGPNCTFLKNIQPPKSAMCKPKSLCAAALPPASIYYGITLMHPVLSAHDTLSFPRFRYCTLFPSWKLFQVFIFNIKWPTHKLTVSTNMASSSVTWLSPGVCQDAILQLFCLVQVKD